MEVVTVKFVYKM